MQNDRFLMFILFFVVACTSKPAAIIEDDCSLKKYKKIDVAFAANETGETFDFDVAKTYTQYLILQLEQKGFVIATDKDKDKNVLLIKSNIFSYNPGSAFKRWLMSGTGKTQATIRTSLIDKMSGLTIGEMVNSEAVSSGGLYSVGANVWILEVIAKGVASEIYEKMKDK